MADNGKPAEWAERLKEAAEKVYQIPQDLEDFDGDRRGHYAALAEAEEAIVDIVVRHFAPVDPLLIEAREIVADYFVANPSLSRKPVDYRSGLEDESGEVKQALTALHRGIELGSKTNG